MKVGGTYMPWHQLLMANVRIGDVCKQKRKRYAVRIFMSLCCQLMLIDKYSK